MVEILYDGELQYSTCLLTSYSLASCWQLGAILDGIWNRLYIRFLVLFSRASWSTFTRALLCEVSADPSRVVCKSQTPETKPMSISRETVKDTVSVFAQCVFSSSAKIPAIQKDFCMTYTEEEE